MAVAILFSHLFESGSCGSPLQSGQFPFRGSILFSPGAKGNGVKKRKKNVWLSFSKEDRFLSPTLASCMVSFSIHASRKLLMTFHRAQKRVTQSLSPSQKFGGVTSLLQYTIRKQPLKSIASQIHRILPVRCAATPMVAKKVNFRDAFL